MEYTGDHIGDNMRGSNNPNWKEGASDYPNHSQLKRNRLEKLKQAGNKCEVCGENAYCVHHIDGDQGNHELDNLAVLCRQCHLILHAGREMDNFSEKPKTSKYIREYGLTLREMAILFGGAPSRFLHMHKLGELQAFLEKHQDKIPPDRRVGATATEKDVDYERI